MDPLRREAVDRTRRMSPEERARETFALIEAGFALKLAGLRSRNPTASEAELEAMLRDWLAER